MATVERVVAPLLSKSSSYGEVGVETARLQRFATRGRAQHVAAFELIVRPRLRAARHLFRGLNRSVGNARNGDKFLIYAVSVPYDVVYERSSSVAWVIDPPPGAVYMVIVEPTDDAEKRQTGLEGWLRWWNWVPEDVQLNGAPANWASRFAQHVWSRP